MSNDFELFADSSDGGNEIDPDIALIAAFLSRELSSVQIAAVQDRMEDDVAFREKVQPLIEGWTLRGSEDARALEIARSRIQRATSLTGAEIEAGWKRHREAPRVERERSPGLRDPARSDLKQQRRRVTVRAAAAIAIIALPIALLVRPYLSGAIDDGARHRGRSSVLDEQRGVSNERESGGYTREQSKFQMGKRSEGQAVRNPIFDLLVDRLDAVTMNISVAPPGLPSKTPGSLRSAALYVSPLRLAEPHAVSTSGSVVSGRAKTSPVGPFVSGSAITSKEDMLRILDVLDRDGFLASAQPYYSEATDKPQGPPPAEKNIASYYAAGEKSPGAVFRLSVFDENYHTYFIIVPSWDKQLVPLLTELRRTVSDSSAKVLLTQLLMTATVKSGRE